MIKTLYTRYFIKRLHNLENAGSKNEIQVADYLKFFSKKKIEYEWVETSCICKELNKNFTINDITIGKYDRYCLDFETVMCQNCGHIRAKNYPKDKHLEDFYSAHYRRLMHKDIIDKEDYTSIIFNSDREASVRRHKFIFENFDIKKNDKELFILDFGGGSGGNLANLTNKGKLLLYDYDTQFYEIAKKGSKSKPKSNALAYADNNNDGKVSLYGEMTHAPAYYAASFDKGGKTSYLKNISKAFIDGRSLIASAKGAKLSDTQRAALRNHAATIESNWEKSLAEAVFKYAGSVYKDLRSIKAKGSNAKSLKKYIKHWGELKGFSLSLQTGRKNLGETAVKLNRLIGFGPVMPNFSQVTDIDSNGNYVKSQSNGLDNYMVHMLKVQKLMIDKMGVAARSNDNVASMGAMIKSLGSGAAAAVGGGGGLGFRAELG